MVENIENIKKEKNDHEIGHIAPIRLFLKKMTPVVGIYLAINAVNFYYNFSVIKNENYDAINNPVFLISSAIYFFILLYYDRKVQQKEVQKSLMVIKIYGRKNGID